MKIESHRKVVLAHIFWGFGRFIPKTKIDLRFKIGTGVLRFKFTCLAHVPTCSIMYPLSPIVN